MSKLFVLAILLLIVSCNGSSTKVEKKLSIIPFREKIGKIKIGMDKARVIKIFKGEKIFNYNESEMYLGKNLRLWSHQSPVFMQGRSLVTFDVNRKVTKIIIYNDYLDIPYQKGFIDSEELFYKNTIN